MGLFDSLTSLIGGGDGQEGGGAMGMLRTLSAQGGSGASSNVVSGLLEGEAAQGGAGQPGVGGLGGMLETLVANGMGEHVASWLSDTPNLPISPQQIHDALGSEQVQQFAASSGLPVGDFLQQIAQHLPAAASEAAGTNTD